MGQTMNKNANPSLGQIKSTANKGVKTIGNIKGAGGGVGSTVATVSKAVQSAGGDDNPLGWADIFGIGTGKNLADRITEATLKARAPKNLSEEDKKHWVLGMTKTMNARKDVKGIQSMLGGGKSIGEAAINFVG